MITDDHEGGKKKIDGHLNKKRQAIGKPLKKGKADSKSQAKLKSRPSRAKRVADASPAEKTHSDYGREKEKKPPNKFV